MPLLFTRIATITLLFILIIVLVAIIAAPGQTLLMSYGASNGTVRQQTLRVVDVNRRIDTRLTDSPIATSISSWHPQHLSVAYSVQTDDVYQLQLKTIRTHHEMTLYSGEDNVDGMAWAPDGDCIAYSLNGNLHIDCDDDALDYVLEMNVYIGFVDWSADGASIVFSGAQLEFQSIELFLLDIDTRNVISLTNDGIAKFTPTFMPDGQHVIYSTFRSDIPRLVMLNIATGTQESLPTNGLDVHSPAVSPDGRYVAFVSGDAVCGGWNIHLLDIEQGTIGQLTNRNGSELSPSWVPLNH